MYKRTTNGLHVNEARREMFAKDSRDLENIPPTAAALFQHALWASFIAGHVWYQSVTASPSLLNVENWDGNLRKVFTSQTGQSYKKHQKQNVNWSSVAASLKKDALVDVNA